MTARRDFGVDLAGPTRADQRWQAHGGKGSAASDFGVDWARRKGTRPRGKGGASRTKAVDDRGAEAVKVEFARLDRGPCQRLPDCVRGPGTRRDMTLRTHERRTALVKARRRETTPEYAALGAVRAGVEGTIPQAVRGFGLRRSRHVGRAKTRLRHVATASAMNLARIIEWLGGALPATTRRSKSRASMAEAA